jgi:hypothetical protein
MNKIYFGKSNNNSFQKGIELFDQPIEGMSTLFVKDYEIGTVDGKNYLLVDKQNEEYLGLLLNKSGQYVYVFKSGDSVIQRSEEGEIISRDGNWIKKGVMTNEGLIVEIGHSIAVVIDGQGDRKTVFKKSLFPKVEDEDRMMQSAQIYLMELKKGYGNTSLPNYHKAARKKSFSSFLRGIGGGSLGSTKQPIAQPQQIKPFKFDKLTFGGRTFGGEGNNEGAREGEVRFFGENDMRILQRGSNGELRWMNADEYQKQLEQKGMKNPKSLEEHLKPKDEQQTKTFKVGEEISHSGEKVTVIDHSQNIVVVEKPDGSKNTFKASEYDEAKEHENIKPEKSAKEETDYQKTAEEHEQKNVEQSQLQYEPHPISDGETYNKEAQRIRDEQLSTPEFNEFKNRVEKEGWKYSGGFEFEKATARKTGDITVNGTLRRLWIPEQKDYLPYFEDRENIVKYNGEDWLIADIDKDGLMIKKGKEEKKVTEYDLDDYRGTLSLDENGNVFVRKGETKLGLLDLNSSFTQQDLLNADTIRIINDEVYANVTKGEGIKFDDVYLGKIRQGIAFFKHGNEVGSIDGNGRSFVSQKKNVRRGISTKQLSASEIDMKGRIKTVQHRLASENPRLNDLTIAKAKLELRSSEGKRIKLDEQKYREVVDKFIADNQTKQDVAESYSNPDRWKANVTALAEQMKVKDAERRREIEAFNALSKSGVLKEVPEELPVGTYMQTAEEMLNTFRRSYSRSVTAEKIKRERGADEGLFDWGELSEIPTTAKAIGKEPIKIRDSRNNVYYVQYAIVPMESVVQSNDIQGNANSEHPEELQARIRSQAHSVMQMKKIAHNINDDVISDSADATRGAPVAYVKDGLSYINQGNGRTAGIKGTTGEERKKYFGMLLTKAKQLGLPTDNLTDKDMLVRVMTPAHTYEDARKLASFGQESPTIPLTEVEAARAYQNANKDVLRFENLNLQGLGNRNIDEQNVGTFIKDNPQIYKQIIESSGYTREAIESHPQIQSRLINTALLAQLNKKFVNDIAKRDDKAHLLVKRITPVLADNQRAVAANEIPKYADIQSFLQKTIKQYDGIDSATKSLLANKNGQIGFLNEDPNNQDSNTLIHKMRQEDLLSTDAKEENTFRDPLQVIGLIAYHQAMNPRLGNDESNEQVSVKRNQAITKFALGIRRFAEALKTLKEDDNDMFGAIKSEAEKKRDQYEQVISIAEKTLLENKPYRSGEEQLSSEEQGISNEQYSSFNVHKKMRTMANSFGFALSGEKIQKSIGQYFFTPLPWLQHAEDRAMIKSIEIDDISNEIKEGNRFYDHEVVEIKMPVEFREFDSPDVGKPNSIPTGTIKLEKLLVNVKEEKPDVFNYFTKSIRDMLNNAISRARKVVNTNPSEAQKEAGNYKKGHVIIQGVEIAIENPKGSYRQGVDPDGHKWKTKMYHDYGYFKSTDGKDGDPVDVFIGDNPESEIVFIVNQVDPKTKKFDEHKCLIGFTNLKEAIDGYKKNYDDNANKRIGSVKTMTMKEFKEWLEDGNMTKMVKSLSCEYDFATTEEMDLRKDLFTGIADAPATRSIQGNVKGVSWKKLGLERPRHKYIRRERGRDGNWEYIYKDAQGKEFSADEKGTPLARQRHWKTGDDVHVGNVTGKIHGISDNVISVKHDDGSITNHNLNNIEHSEERQSRLRKQKESLMSKWDTIISHLEEELKTGESSEARLSAQLKLNEAREQKAKVEDKEKNSDIKGMKKIKIPKGYKKTELCT